MKIETKVNDLKVQGIVANVQSAFTVEVNDAHVFETLIQFYKQPIKSIARELLSNAKDSHVMAGCPERPVYVQIPTLLNNNFMIRDFGTGIPPEQFKHIYCRFFGSDKRHNNDTIGGFGLGSKTPFAYTTNYTVTNYYDGIKYVYAFFMNEENIPQDVQVEAVETSEENGLAIEFCVQEKDFNAFIDAVFLAGKHLAVKPESNHVFNWEDAPANQEKLFEGQDWYCLEENLSHYEKNYVVLGGIEYPVPSSDLNQAMTDIGYADDVTFKVNHVLNLGVYMLFDIGALRPIPSRESLMWIPKNTNAVVARLLEIYEFIGEALTNEICIGTTSFENKYFSYRWFSKSGRKAHDLKVLYRHYAGIGTNDENPNYEVALNFAHYGIWDVENKLGRYSRSDSTTTKKMTRVGGHAKYGFFVKLKHLSSDYKIKIAVTSGKSGFKSALKEHGGDLHYVCLVDKNQADVVCKQLEEILIAEGADKYIECVNFDQEMKKFVGSAIGWSSGNVSARLKVGAEKFQAKTIRLAKFIDLLKQHYHRLDPNSHLDVDTFDNDDVYYYVEHYRNSINEQLSGMTVEALLALELEDFDSEDSISDTSILWLNEKELEKLEAKGVSLINLTEVVFNKLKTMKTVCEDQCVSPILERKHLALVESLSSKSSWVKSLKEDSPLKMLINQYRESKTQSNNAHNALGKKESRSDLVKWYTKHFINISEKRYTLDFTKHEKEILSEHYPLLVSTFSDMMEWNGSTYNSSLYGQASPFILKYVQECDHNARLKLLGML